MPATRVVCDVVNKPAGDCFAALKAERDFLRRLLDLSTVDNVAPLLEEALGLIVDVSGASKAYVELYDEYRAEPRFWVGRGVTEEDAASIHTSISRGMIARTIADGRIVNSPSALDDPDFGKLGSVRKNQIRAALYAPVGSPPIGALCLQIEGRVGSFSDSDVDRIELFARQLAPLADRLVAKRPSSRSVDFTTDARSRFLCVDIIGRSQALAAVLHQAALVAPVDVDVLLTGPSGTGKSALARAIARNSPRSASPFVELNCATMPESLVESELFGAEKGAHSTATRNNAGKVAAAEGGTLFLDEVGELSPGSQAKLLQLLQDREYYALGSAVRKKANVRVISATNANLLERVEEKSFREDLYYRLHVLPISVPGLAERREDIPDLVEHFCEVACRRFQHAPLRVSRQLRLACREAEWPGNVRQLRHAIEAGVIRARGENAKVLVLRHVFPDVGPPHAESTDEPLPYKKATQRFQRRYLEQMLADNDWNVSKTARQLGIGRSYLHGLIRSFDLARDASSPGE